MRSCPNLSKTDLSQSGVRFILVINGHPKHGCHPSGGIAKRFFIKHGASAELGIINETLAKQYALILAGHCNLRSKIRYRVQFNNLYYYTLKAGESMMKRIVDNNHRAAPKAAKWFREAAEQGVASAQYNLGLCYENGTGVAQDAKEAVKWFRKAAVQEYADAQLVLGLCYLYGRGVAQDEQEAIKWFLLAAEQGYVLSQYCLGLCYEEGLGVTRDGREAVKWYRLAAEQRDTLTLSIVWACAMKMASALRGRA